MTEPTRMNCLQCGGIHFGSVHCPYVSTICDCCDKPLIQHDDYVFCEGGKTKHDPTNKDCSCESCVYVRVAATKAAKANIPCPACGVEPSQVLTAKEQP
jgi:hypothetical protein